MSEIYVKLTKKQMKKLAPILDKARYEGENGRPGMAIMQFDENGVGRAGFAEHDYAVGIRKAFRKYMKRLEAQS